MKIRLSDNNDINGIISLWHEAFGDSEKEIKLFIDNRYIPDNTLICELNGEIISMLFLLDGMFTINGYDYPAYYLYAACTAKKYRGRRVMTEMLDEANRVSASRGYDFICLMPGEKSLFDFYEKHGYSTVFSKKILTVNRSEFEGIISTSSDENTANDYEVLRNKAFKKFDYFKWDNNAIDFAVMQTKYYGGNELTTCNGYCLYSMSNGDVSVKEFAFTPQDALCAIRKIFDKTNADKLILNLPSDYEINCGKYEIFPSAMALPLNQNSEKLIKSINNAYLGLTLD